MLAPPFRPLAPGENRALVDAINRSGAEILLIALGCPKQEEWMYRNRDQMRPVMVGLGAAFGVYAGLQRRAPSAMQRSGLEWLFRLSQEPGRLWKRYLVTNLRFLAYVFRGREKSPLEVFD
jgi:N-acetylglucosaminyldiphosphoundecaprenol N-acetyl-beta-D-mannosaminyltransferase